MYKRLLEKDLQNLSKDWSVISLTGPRQSGKTTLCKMAFPDYAYINLERASTRTLMRDTEQYLSQFESGVIIDEAQYMPEVFSAIQVLVDENPSLRFVLSGSSDFLMMQNISQSLAGRVVIRRLLPLAMSELGPDADATDLDTLMWKGFYPAVWASDKTPEDVYDSYVSTYIQRDVRQIVNIGDLNTFQHFLTACACRVGTEWNAQAIGNEIAASSVTVKRWMNILETSYTAFCLQPFFHNIGKRLSKTPKIYFYDVGLVCHLLGIENVRQLSHHPLRGAIFENMVIVEMLKKRFNQGLGNNLFFYRDKSGCEVDVVEMFAEGIYVYEIKSAQSVHPEFFKNLNYLRSLLGDELVKAQVIYNGSESFPAAVNGVLPFRKFVME